MLSALRGFIQRWVGMTTEVQTLEAGEAPAVPAATPTCSTDYAANAATRRLKRSGTLANDGTDLKRPRTAPTTPIDAGVNGANPPTGKASDPDGWVSIPTDQPNAARPSTATSAPAAINRAALRSQPSVSTPTQPPATSPPGSCSASGAFAPSSIPSRHCGAISGVLTASPLQPPHHHHHHHQQQQQQPQRHASGDGIVFVAAEGSDRPSPSTPLPPPPQQQQQPQHEHQHQVEQQQTPLAPTPLQLLPALHRISGSAATAAAATGVTAVSLMAIGTAEAPAAAAANGGNVPGGGVPGAAGAGTCGLQHRDHNHHHHHHHHNNNNNHTPHHNGHHRHDALEEQVFSPAFHLPASLASSPQPNPPPRSPQLPPQPPLHGGGDELGSGPSVGTGAAAAEEEKAVPATMMLAPAAVVVVAAAAVAAASGGLQQHLVGGEDCAQLHAIDLNVVEGVDVETEDDEELAAVAATATAAAPTAAAAESVDLQPDKVERSPRRPQSHHGGQSPGGSRGDLAATAAGEACCTRRVENATSSVSVSDGVNEAVGEELSSSSVASEADDEAEGGAAAAARRASGCDEEAELYYECDDDNDENAPVNVGRSSATPVGTAAAGAVGRSHVIVMAGAVTAARQQEQEQHQVHQDAVLVASAPRGLAAVVSAAVVVPVGVQQAEQLSRPLSPSAEGDEEEEEVEEDEDEGLMEFDPLMFIKQLPPLESCVSPHRQLLLPLQTRAMARRKTLVLDLDETLVHSSLEAVDRSDFSFPVLFNGTEHQVFVRQRPHLLEFMVRVAALFEVVVFTASQRIYAEKLLDFLDPQQQLVRHRIYRDSCVVVDGNYLKDLSILGRDLAHTVIVDNSPQAFGFQVDNGVPIESWYDDDNDTELLRLLPFLESLAGDDVADVRPRIRSQFRLRELIDRA